MTLSAKRGCATGSISLLGRAPNLSTLGTPAMKIVVQKYGGSSVATVEKVREVAKKIVDTRRRGFAVVVVVSAMGNTTDELLTLAREVSPDPPRRELDMLLSVGERISMALLSTAIQHLGEEAISFTGSQVGIVTTDSHSNARIIDVRPFRVQDELERGKIVIVAGYQGTSYRREITTLGRGGSDTTAVALAAALGAEACEIYSDVAGVFTADPRTVLSASRLDEISYEEMQELARHGAKVLNAQAVEFARRHQIAIYARATFGSQEETVVRRMDGFPETALREIENGGVRSVASSKHRVLCSYETMSTGENRFLDVLDDASHLDVVACSMAAQSDRGSMLISTENVPDVDGLARDLRAAFPDTLTVSIGLGTVTAVGLGLGRCTEPMRRAIRALHDARVSLVYAFVTRDSVCCVVRRELVDEATQVVHDTFLGSSEG